MRLTNRTRDRLRESLRATPTAAPIARSVEVGEPFRRAPESEGRVIVWRERFDAGAESSTPPAAMREIFGDGVDATGLARDLAHAGLDIERLRFFDIETCGLADHPIFLFGALRFDRRGIELVQVLAPDPSAESAMLESAAELLAAPSIWVSFNGKSFDAPRLRRRARHHGVAWPEPEHHRDLLHETRRRWKDALPNCKLTTVEERLLGLERWPGDVPGREVPERYWDWVESRQRRWIEPVIEHNRRDVAAMAVLLRRLEVEG